MKCSAVQKIDIVSTFGSARTCSAIKRDIHIPFSLAISRVETCDGSHVWVEGLGVGLIMHAVPCVAAHSNAMALQASNAGMGKHFDRAE